MMKKSAFVLSLVIAVTALSGQVLAAPKTVAGVAQQAKTVEVKQNNPYEVAGIDSAAELSKFFSKLQKEVKAKK